MKKNLEDKVTDIDRRGGSYFDVPKTVQHKDLWKQWSWVSLGGIFFNFATLFWRILDTTQESRAKL